MGGTTKYPEVKVKLSERDGNAFAILGRVRRALENHGISQEEIKQFTDEATSGNYDHLLRTCCGWVDVQ